MLGNFSCLFAISIFKKIAFLKKKIEIPSVLNSFDPDQAGHLIAQISVHTVCKCFEQRSAIHAASQLPGRGPTDVDDAPASAS